MLKENLSTVAVGAVIAALGLLTWKKQTTRFLHRYHYRNVKEADVPAYTKQMGVGELLVGLGICVTGLLRLYTESLLSWAGLIAGLAAGPFVMHKAQMRYNGSWFRR